MAGELDFCLSMDLSCFDMSPALLSILEDPQSLTLWLKDREICCILNYLILLHNTEVSGGRKLT